MGFGSSVERDAIIRLDSLISDMLSEDEESYLLRLSIEQLNIFDTCPP